MSRLTSRDEHGHAYFPQCFEDPCNGSGCQKEQCEYLNEVCEKLASYEDTGLSTEQIIEIDKLYSEKCRELEKEQKKQEWIPCSERLPEESGKYEVTALDAGRLIVTQVKWQPKLKSWNLTGAMAYWKITAWKPLPEPYNPDKCHGCFGAASNDCGRCSG